jgi:Integrase core domain/HTH-like domain
MIDRSHELPLSGQAKALGISRGSIYYLARPTSDADLALMRRIDELHLEHPFAGSRMLRDMLKAEGREIGRRRASTLMKKMGVEAIYRRPNTSKPAPGHKIYPYLLRNLAVTRPNQVWAADITYVPMARGFVYLVAIVDWFSRRLLAWRTGDLQYGPGKPVHLDRLHQGAEDRRNRDQHGRQGRLARQRLRRAALADGQIRGGLPPSLRRRRAGPRVDRPVSEFLQTARGRIRRLAGKLPIRHIPPCRRQSRRRPEMSGRAT